MVYIRLFGRVFEVDLRSPGTHPRYRRDGRWVFDPFLSNQQVLFDSAAEAVPSRSARSRVAAVARRLGAA